MITTAFLTSSALLQLHLIDTASSSFWFIADWVIDCEEAPPHLLKLHKISNQSIKWHLQQFIHNSGSLSLIVISSFVGKPSATIRYSNSYLIDHLLFPKSAYEGFSGSQVSLVILVGDVTSNQMQLEIQ